MTSQQETHAAVMAVAARAPLELHQVPTVAPTGDEIMIKVEWVASSPLDLHQADGGLLVKFPHISGGNSVGTVLAVGPDVKHFRVGDEVFGYQWRQLQEKSQQEKVTAPEWLFAKIPAGITKPQAATVPENLITIFHTLTKDIGLSLPWPKPDDYVPPEADQPILIWGASSSVGQYALQVLRFYGYRTLLAAASQHQHEHLRKCGATQCFDYRAPDVVEQIRRDHAVIPRIIDCIGSQDGTLRLVAQVATRGTRVAVMLPVIVRHATLDSAPEYTMDVATAAAWADGVETRGVRTHFYLDNEDFKQRLQLEILPELLRRKIIEPNRYEIVEGANVLVRAQKALGILRSGTLSGKRLVWRIAEE